MIGRRRPLVRAAMVGGGAYAAGKHRQRSQSAEADQEQRLEAVERQQAAPPQAAAPQAAAPASVDVVGKLKELTQLKESGALSEEEFEAAKQKLLAS